MLALRSTDLKPTTVLYHTEIKDYLMETPKGLKQLSAEVLALVFSSLGLLMALGCSQQYRSADPGISDVELMSRLEQVSTLSGQATSGDLSLFNALVFDDPLSTIYYAEGPGPLGPPESVMSLTDFSFVRGLPGGVTPFDLQSVLIAFVHGFSGDRPAASLLVQIQFNGQTYTEVLSNSSDLSFSDKDFGVEMSGPGGTLILRSFDVSDTYEGELASVIQLKVYTYDGAGEEVYIGKFSTLVGFGGVN